MPGISSSGNARPQSTMTISSPHSKSVKFLPISLRPPRKYTLTDGFCFALRRRPFVCAAGCSDASGALAGCFSRAVPPCAARGARFVRVSFFGGSCAAGFAAFFPFSGFFSCFAASGFSAAFLRGRFAGFSIGSEIFPTNAASPAAALSGWSCFFWGVSPSDAGLINLFTFLSDK